MGRRNAGAVLGSLHAGEEFDSREDVQRFEHALAVELEKGTIERIPVGRLLSHSAPEEWYREKASGVVYRYVPPEFPLKGHWARVEEPGARSFFEQLCATDAPSDEEYAGLVRALEALWRRGEVERVRDAGTRIQGVTLYHHRPTDETFELMPPGAFTARASWRKVFRSHADGSWPGKLQLDVPPAPNEERKAR